MSPRNLSNLGMLVQIPAQVHVLPKFIAVVRQQFVFGDQLLDFSVPELVRSQSTFSSDPEILQNCTCFTLCSSAGLAVGEFSVVMGLTPCMLCVHINCVLHVCIGLLCTDFSTVNTRLGRPMLWKPLCLLSTPEGLATTNYQYIRLLKFSSQKWQVQ